MIDGGIDLLADLRVDLPNLNSSGPLDVSPQGGRSASRSSTWSAYMSFNSSNVKLPFLTTRCQYWGVDLPADLGVDLPIAILDH